METFFHAFDKKGTEKLDLSDFKLLCQVLFQNANGMSYPVKEKHLKEMFDVFDKDSDGFIDRQEFSLCWDPWIKTIYKPVSACLIVDVQNDFITGSLAISNCPAKQDGLAIIKPINDLLESVNFNAVFYTLDWHPDNHISFIDNVSQRPIHKKSAVATENAKTFDTVIFDTTPPVEQKLWPRHCVQNTWGADLHGDLKVVDGATKIYKGTNPNIDSYSAFWDNNKIAETALRQHLQEKSITDIYVCGLAYDVCVRATIADALSHGYRAILIEDCCRGVDLVEIEKTREMVLANHGVVVDSQVVGAMVEGRDRRPELGYKLALELKEKLSK